jgi:alginate O-acetyltransferase complex protein AlgI
VPLSWAMPRALAWDGVAAWTLVVLASLAPVAVVWLAASAVGTVGAMQLGRRLQAEGAVALAWTALLVACLLAARETKGWTLIGPAYFTLRNLHVLFDGWMGRLAIPSVRRMLRYQLFLPVLAVGPIHRLQHFERECDRRRFDAAALASGAERALFGLVQAVVLGGPVVHRFEDALLRSSRDGAFLRDWAASAFAWVQLYLTFAGLSGVAVGIALMMGLRIEENFDRPYRARSLVDFWTRWHITLSSWCRDYVFRPVTALTRRPVVGLFAAMLAIGLWHETSAYYLLWAVWQVLGIVLNRLLFPADDESPRFGRAAALAPVAVFGWLSLANPVLSRLLDAAT